MENGTRLKDCRLSLEAYVHTSKAVDIDKSYVVRKDDDTVNIVIVMDDAKRIGSGNIKIAVHIGIPDGNFPDGYRDQTYEVWMD